MTNKPEPIDGWCGICADCAPQINGGSGFKNCAEAHDAQLAEDIGMNKRLTDERIAELIKMADTYCITYAEESEDTAVALRELQERRKADSAEPIYQYRIRNGYNGQVTEWQTIRRDQVDFVLKAQPLNAEFRIISAPQPAPVVPVTLPCAVELKPGLIIGKGCKTETLLTALQRRADYCAEIDAMTPEERAEHDANIAVFKAMLPPSALDSKQVSELTMWVK
ncbi:TPA: hypothetical protein MNC23_005344, partial [Citrobacter freundii]|nr:hypothetical protein [Citrobacter freundii]HBZ9504012.1 hypothetical protein [Citrobacter freundii]HBZ9532393.1 hypothetical protein [Citrobacter freundii]HBZ9619973.1 hypothetical protein [Citrobacter freundii]HBZ9863149.1 hypothetical protein [Citrobacter freundii]